MNDGTRSAVVIAPLATPTATARTNITASTHQVLSGSPLISSAAATDRQVISAPTDRSSSPATSTNNWPAPSSINGAARFRNDRNTGGVRNVGSVSASASRTSSRT